MICFLLKLLSIESEKNVQITKKKHQQKRITLYVEGKFQNILRELQFAG